MFPVKKFLVFSYYVASAVACLTVVHFVGFSGFHAWDRVVFGFPFGFVSGWLELLVFPAAAAFSGYLAFVSFKNCL